MSGGGAGHWDAVYGARAEAALTWFEADPALSLRLIAAHAGPDAPVIDVGAGASRLVDALLARGYGRLTCLDLSAAALGVAQARLGAAAARVSWVVADVTAWAPEPGAYAVWHDRAAFHFLTDAAARRAYLSRMAAALRPGGHAILMTFAEDGPEMCSGLPVQRWSPAALAAEVEAQVPGAFAPVASERHLHHTPKGGAQGFQASVFRRL
ncbi:class I SAM-dependent methyltransferase [Roseicyclus persicicus]|uniref:Class I SAM-dependent methyltransferase n=1 Tax=Roseicyclus persicicus TaxID=2650661 RepID=A0A7X6GWK4_9RHOB|nr:class I SAM-dependent methyltransferase [Roseibacterium persicicum]NKX43009.1 class I SAM-dependent methyltransferase [Roseibacterium persicicum]